MLRAGLPVFQESAGREFQLTRGVFPVPHKLGLKSELLLRAFPASMVQEALRRISLLLPAGIGRPSAQCAQHCWDLFGWRFLLQAGRSGIALVRSRFLRG